MNPITYAKTNSINLNLKIHDNLKTYYCVHDVNEAHGIFSDRAKFQSH